MRPIDGDHLRLTVLGWLEVLAKNDSDGLVEMVVRLFLKTLDSEPTIKEAVEYATSEKAE